MDLLSRICFLALAMGYGLGHVLPSTGTFRAAVCELDDISINMLNNTPSEIINTQLGVIAEYAQKAKKEGADIVVFSEYGVTGGIIAITPPETILQYMQEVPDPRRELWNPCLGPKHSNFTWILETLSCLARNNSMYLVANIGDKHDCDNKTDPDCPNRGFYLFNTDVVFNRYGDLIARYHKINLYGETPPFDSPPLGTFEYISFDTEFGKFGIFTCFDILFYDPAIQLYYNQGIRQFVFPTSWVETWPLFGSVQMQSAWAKGLGINLLAANRHLPRHGAVGSGIYGPDGPLTYVYNPDSGNTLLIADVPIITSSQNFPKTQQSLLAASNNFSDVNHTLHITRIPLDLIFNLTKLVPDNSTTSGSKTVCHNDLCCSTEYELNKPLTDATYLMAAYRGHLPTMGHNPYFEICVILLCATENFETCAQISTKTDSFFKHLSLSGNFRTDYIYPNAMTTDMNLVLDYEFNKRGHSITLENMEKAVFSVDLNARVYGKDTVL